MPTVLIPDGHSWHGTNVVRCLGACRRYRLIACAPNTFPPIRGSRHVDQFVSLPDLNDVIDVADHVEKLFHQHRFEVLLPIDSAIGPISACRNRLVELGIRVAPVPSTQALSIANDKLALAEFLASHELPHPETHAATDMRIFDMSYPVLYKPRTRSNGIGIARFDEPNELRKYLSHNPNAGKAGIVQREIAGDDIDCSVICQNGEVVAWTIQKPLLPGRQFRAAKAIEFSCDERLLAIVKSTVRALGWTGVAHFDLRYDVDMRNLFLIEINPRFWGSVLGSLLAGVNFPALACELASDRMEPTESYQVGRRYCGTNAYLSQLIPRKRRVANRFSWGESQLQYVVQDPLPEIIERFAK